MTDLLRRIQRLQGESQALRQRLREAEETLAALRSGEVDALVVEGPQGEQVYSLKGADHSYRVLVESMQEGALILGEGGDVLYANRFSEKLLGTPLEKIVGSPFQQWVAPEDLPAYEALLRRSNPGSAAAEMNLSPEGGARVPVHLSVSRILLEEMPILCVTATDLTRRKREERILAEECLSRSIIEQSVDAIVVCDEDGRIVRAGKAAFELAGEDILQEAFDEVFRIRFCRLTNASPNGHSDGEPFSVCKVMAGETYQSREACLRKEAEGRTTTIQLLLGAAPLADEDGRVIGAIVNLSDITDRKRAEEERSRMERQLLQAQKMEAIGTLAGGIAHDFNNILAAVIGFTELSLDEVEAGSFLEDNLREVHTAGKRAKELVQQILTMSRQDKLELKPVQVHLIVKEALKLLRATLPTTISIVQNIQSRSLVLADPARVHQIMMNLCTNAAYSMEEKGGALRVGLEDVDAVPFPHRQGLEDEPGEYLKLTVADTGAGIPAHLLSSIFEPYFTTKPPGEGTGLGLSVVHGIVKSYGGEILAESEPGQGTVFTVYLPVLKARTTEKTEREEAVPKGHERLLFVDDEVAILKMAEQILGRLGYFVETRTSPLEALELFKKRSGDFDLVITDMTMPHMTGDTLAAQLIKVRPDIPVVLCTGYSRKISDERAAKMGIRAFEMKPLARLNLAKTVRRVLDEAKARSSKSEG